MSVRKGQDWGEPVSGPVDLEVTGDDAALAAVAAAHPGALVRFRPVGSDLARAVGLRAEAEPSGVAVPIDAIALEPGEPGEGEPAEPGTAPALALALNMVVLGPPPGRLRAMARSAPVQVRVDGRAVHAGPATTVVIANGQFLDGDDVVPRGHPGDGRLEVQVYALGRGERRAMRARLPTGTHVPHPRITTAVGRRVEVDVETGARACALQVDGRHRPPVRTLRATVAPAVIRLLV